MKPIRHLSCLLLGLAALQAHAQLRPRVDAAVDLLEAFSSARVTDSAGCDVRRPGAAGGVKQDALFQHPHGPGRPARVRYELDLPAIGAGELLLLAFDIAISDGVKLGPQEDGVRFVVEVDGQRLFTGDARETRWQPGAADLKPFAGRRVALTLLTDARANSSYDWALWGQPRLLRFRGGTGIAPDADGRLVTPATIGALAAPLPANRPFQLRLRPRDGSAPREWTLPTPPAEGPRMGWLVREFAFPKAAALEVEWEPRDALTASNLWLAPFPPRLEVTRLSPLRALVTAGSPVPVRVTVSNRGPGRLADSEARVTVQAGPTGRHPFGGLGEKPLPPLVPSESWSGEWDWTPREPGPHSLLAHVTLDGEPGQHSRQVEVRAPTRATESLSNHFLRIEFARQPEGFAFARVFARQGEAWAPVAVWTPLGRIAADRRDGRGERELHFQSFRRTPGAAGGQRAELTGASRDADGAEWTASLRVELPPDRPLARVRYEWKASQERRVRALGGPSLYVGEGATGEAKTWGLFPGLEYLYGAERSSNPRDFVPHLADRRTPHPHKVTLPLMAVTLGPESQPPPADPGRFFAPDSLKDQPLLDSLRTWAAPPELKSDITVGLWWNPHQQWDGEHAFPAPRFSSPNLDEGMANHRLGLFLPSTPDFVPENAERAAAPFPLPAGKTLALEATLLVAPGPAMVAVRGWLDAQGGLPAPNPWPRSFQQALDVCRAGLLTTVWDARTEKWRHCIDWAPSHAPGLAALLWMDAQLTAQSEARRHSRERVELAARNMLRDGGAGLFTSQAACHIMQWQFPFFYGHLPEAMAGLPAQIEALIRSQQADGGWRQPPGQRERADLGQAGDSVLGTCAHHAMTLLRYARLTGDPGALAAGEKALRFMERFRVPRGGQTWECPMYEPDILPAGYAVGACLDAWRITGHPRWLHAAVYWAEAGVPFIYLWTLPDKPMMLGATIPVFGSTFFTHTWLAVPVQWCGLVYAWHVFHLAEELQRVSLPQTDSPLPLALGFAAADGRRLVEHITVSGLYQQYAEGERIGAYPDSISGFEQRNPAFLNPEDILVNVLALRGHNPDVKTARLTAGKGEVVISSGAEVRNARTTEGGVRFDLEFYAGEPSHSLVAGFKPGQVRVNDQPLPKSEQPVKRDPGWWWDEKFRRAYLTVAHPQSTVRVELLPP